MAALVVAVPEQQERVVMAPQDRDEMAVQAAIRLGLMAVVVAVVRLR